MLTEVEAKTTEQKAERRTVVFPLTEVRIEGGDGKNPVLVGHAAVFDSPSEDLGGFVEVVKPGAFKKTIKEADVRALFNHNPDMILGRTKSRTLRLEEDKTGLRIEIDPPDTTYARDLLESMGRGDVDQMSFAFRPVKEAWTESKGKEPDVRELLEVELYDVSPVTYPAYPATDVGIDMRAIEALRGRAKRGELTDSDQALLKTLDELRSEPPPEPATDDAASEEPAPMDEASIELILMVEDWGARRLVKYRGKERCAG